MAKIIRFSSPLHLVKIPKIAIAVFIENGGWGGSYAAPIASLVMERYLKGNISPSRIWIENRMLEANLLADL